MGLAPFPRAEKNLKHSAQSGVVQVRLGGVSTPYEECRAVECPVSSALLVLFKRFATNTSPAPGRGFAPLPR